jgi:hypothetical protein
LLIRLAVLSLLLLLVGCVEEKDTLTIYPNGAGTIHIHRKFGERFSGVLTMSSSSQVDKEAIKDSLYKDLAHWQGITAWAPATASLENGRVIHEIIGYFNDVAAVKYLEGSDSISFSWAANSAGGRFRCISQRTEGPDPLGSDIPEGMTDMFQGMRMERVIILPGAVKTCSGCTEHSDRSASFVITGDDVVKMLDLTKDYRARVAANQMTKEQAAAEYKQKTKALDGNLEITFSPSNAGGEFEQFEKDYQNAKTEFAASGTAEKIQRASLKP